MRRSCQPVFVDENGNQSSLQRIHFADKHVAEAFLQAALHRTPQILPVDEFDGDFGPLVSLGREVDNVDNLFISPSGRLTIVETKLWRNPQATREVVAQILDYAVRISNWSYTELEERSRGAIHPAPIGSRSLYEFVSAFAPDEMLSEPDFVDAVQRTLKTGRFLLLVVGDGIRENIEAMVESLHGHPQRHFTFGLVELQLFTDESAPGKQLIVPQIVANTTEIIRAVVRVETTGQASVSVEIDEPVQDDSQPNSRRTLSRDEFFREIADSRTKNLFSTLLSQCSALGAEPDWRASSVSIRLPDPGGSSHRLTLFVMTTRGEIYTGWLYGQLERIGKPPRLASEYVDDLCSLFPGVEPHDKHPEGLSRKLRAADVAAKHDEFIDVVQNLIERIEAS